MFFWNLCTDQVLPEPSQTLIILAYALVVTVAGIQYSSDGTESLIGTVPRGWMKWQKSKQGFWMFNTLLQIPPISLIST